MSLSNLFTVTIASAGSMPSWYPASAGTLINLSSVLGQSTSSFTLLDSIGVNSTTYPAGTYDSRRLDPYSGGALIYESGRPFIHLFGGGHDDGSWNGTTKYGPLYGTGSNTPVWAVGASPSPPASVIKNSANGRYADGKPSSQHTYNIPVGVGPRLWMPAAGISYSNPGGSGPLTPNYWDSATDSWTFPAWSRFPVPPNIGGGGGSAQYNNNIYLYPPPGDPQRLRVLNLSSGVWITDSVDTTLGGDSPALAVDTRRGALLAIAGSTAYSPGAYWPDLSNLSVARRTNINAPPSLSATSLEYDYDRDVFVVPSTTSTSIYELSASSLASGSSPAWTTRTFSGITPTGLGPQGICGRFRYIQELRGYISVPGGASPVYFYRAT